MEENLSTTGEILEILGDLELPLLNRIEEKEEGYEVMVSLPRKKGINKAFLKNFFEEHGMVVVELDVYREETERYAWFVLKKNEEVTNG